MPFLITILLLSACGPEAPPQAPVRLPPTVNLNEVGPGPPRIEWTIQSGEGPKRAERLGRMAVALEASLYQSALPVGPAGPPPAVSAVPVDNVHSLELRLPEGQPAEANLCLPDGICETYYAEGTPEEVGTALATQVLTRLRLDAPAFECLSRPPSADDYATLFAGRSAAATYGLSPREGTPGDPRTDPIARAVFLDTKAAGAQWLAARDAWARGDMEQAALFTRYATQACPEHLGWAADHALAQALFYGALRPFPREPRFTFAAIDASLATSDPGSYDRILDAMVLWPLDASLARRAADVGPEAAQETLLADWADKAPVDPEPVRRLAARAIRDSDWKRLLQHADELERRGVDASDLATPALLGLGKIERALRRAPPALVPRLQARLGAPSTGGSPEELLLRAEQALKDDPSGALHAARTALAARPMWPEALVLAARAAELSGQDAATYRARLAEVEP